MKKKILLTIGMLALIVPFEAKALTGKVTLTCDKTSLKPTEVATCSIDAKTNEKVASVNALIQLVPNLKLESITTNPAWQGNGEGGDIKLYTDTGKNGDFNIATFKVKASDIKNGANTTISLADVRLGLDGGSFEETNFTVTPLNIRIKSTINTLNIIKADGNKVPDFGLDKTEQSYVTAGASSINIEVEKTDTHSTVKGNIGVQKLNYGLNTFKIDVISETGVTKTYTLKITKSEVRNLSSLKINNQAIKLEAGKYNYTLKVNNDIKSADIKATLANEKKATFVEGFGERKVDNLKVGENKILIKTKDENGEELVYTITIDRQNTASVTPPIENPKTDSTFHYGILAILLSIISGGVYFVIRKRNKFPNNI